MTLQLCKGDRGIKVYVLKTFDYLVHQLYAVTGPQWTQSNGKTTDINKFDLCVCV